MTPQVFRGRTALEAHNAALEQLGPEAVVLTTRSVARSGIGGWFGAADIELAATLPHSAQDSARSTADVPFARGAYLNVAASLTSPSDVAAVRAELKGDIRSLKTMLAKSADSTDLAAEIGQLRELVEGLAGAKPRRDKVVAQLHALGIEGPALNAIVRALKGRGDGASASREELARVLRAAAWPLEEGPVMIAVVGPSGVGKTTTAAKLAARARMDGKTVTLVACDSYRVGAVEQLASYADLMGADLATAHTSDELRTLIDAARTDVVIVDTSGRPPAADGVEIALAPRRSGSAPPATRKRHVLLCVPAALRYVDAARLVRRYGALSPTSLVITKIDETDAPSGIVHASWVSKLPISVLCFGQRVPEDIGAATIGALVDYVAPIPVSTGPRREPAASGHGGEAAAT
jgi:flagellar biosynthesis protein FlhF